MKWLGQVKRTNDNEFDEANEKKTNPLRPVIQISLKEWKDM